MQTYTSLFERELAILIAEQVNKLRDDLESGDTRTDFIRGQIYGLRGMTDLMAEANKRADQGNR